MINVSEELKKACNDNSTISYSEYIIIDNVKVIVNAKLSANAFKDKSFFGTFNMKTIEFETNNDIDYKKKEFDYFIVVNSEPIKIGRFIVTEITDNDTNGLVKITAQDYALKFAINYVSDLDYSSGLITLFEVLQEACQKAGVNLENTSIDNGDFIVDSKQFNESTLIGDVVSCIAGISGNFATINNENKLELIFTKATTETIENYIDLDDKRDSQAITTVVLGNKNIQGQEAIRRDQALIDKYGEHFLIINDNPFAYTREKREALVDAIFNKVKGFAYSSFESKNTFKPYMTLGDLVEFKTREGKLVKSIILKIDKDYSDFTLSAPSIAKASVDYKEAETAIDIAKRVEIIVDLDKELIKSIVQKTETIEKQAEDNSKVINETKTNLTEIKQTTENIQFQVTDIVDNGVSKVKNTLVNIDQEGMRVSKSGEEINTLISNTGMYVNDHDTNLLTADKNGVVTENLLVRTYANIGYHRFEKFIENGEKRTRLFLYRLGGIKWHKQEQYKQK